MFCACCLLARPLHAADKSGEPTVRVELTFDAPPDCTSVADFKRRVSRRTERIAWVQGPPYTGTAVVTLGRVASDVRVRLAWTRDNQGATVREFRAPNCEEAADAAALIIAITFDPSAPGSAASTGTEANTSTQGEPDTDATRRNADSPGGDNQTGVPAAEARPSGDPETQALDIPRTDAGALGSSGRYRREPQLGFSAAAHFEGMQGLTPAPMEGFGASAAISWGEGLFFPELRLVFVHFLGLTYPAAGGDSHFELDAARVVACPMRLGVEEYSLRPCLSGLAGRLEASGRNTLNPQSHSRAAWLLGGSLVASFRPKSVLLLMADVTAGVPLQRDRFQFSPEQFHQVSTLVLSAGVGVGLQFP